MKREKLTGRRAAVPALPCACASLRRAARAVTRLYDQELRVTGLEPTQFTLLMALSAAGEASQGELGKLLALDTTTLTRTLRLLKKRGWIGIKTGDDRRVRLVRLTASGQQKFRQSQPLWEKAQGRLEKALGPATWGQLREVLTVVTRTLARG